VLYIAIQVGGCYVAVGLQATRNQFAYSASKWALECLGEALTHEVFRFGVRVVNVEPRVIMTNIFENSAEQTRYDKTSPYQPIMRRNGAGSSNQNCV
jgi:NAD(P)-dependent dehydrogenase (short-subunit alcohol dehydrogenase family)